MSKKSATAEKPEKPATARTRSMGTIMVEKLGNAGAWSPVQVEGAMTTGDPALTFDTTAKAERWITENGEDDSTYRVMREVLVVTVKTETVRKTVLQKK